MKLAEAIIQKNCLRLMNECVGQVIPIPVTSLLPIAIFPLMGIMPGIEENWTAQIVC